MHQMSFVNFHAHLVKHQRRMEKHYTELSCKPLESFYLLLINIICKRWHTKKLGWILCLIAPMCGPMIPMYCPPPRVLETKMNSYSVRSFYALNLFAAYRKQTRIDANSSILLQNSKDFFFYKKLILFRLWLYEFLLN